MEFSGWKPAGFGDSRLLQIVRTRRQCALLHLRRKRSYQRYLYITFRRVGLILLLAVCSWICYCFWFHGKLMCLVLPCSLLFLRFHAAHENKKSKSCIFFAIPLYLQIRREEHLVSWSTAFEKKNNHFKSELYSQSQRIFAYIEVQELFLILIRFLSCV